MILSTMSLSSRYLSSCNFNLFFLSSQVRKLRLAIEQGREELVVIKNYRRNGSSYWSRVQIAPIRDSNDRITLIVSVQYEVRKYHECKIPMI